MSPPIRRLRIVLSLPVQLLAVVLMTIASLMHVFAEWIAETKPPPGRQHTQPAG